MSRLVLFDIDGTLITAGRAARDAFRDALVDVYGYQGDVSRFDFSGRTDPQIATMILRDDGRSDAEIGPLLPALWEHYLAGLQRNLGHSPSRTLSGIDELLHVLAAREDVTLALLTGNVERGARLKLEPPGLNRFFPFGAFGSDSADRAELPPIAVARASQHCGIGFSGRDVVIIGDSIYDVRCGVPHGATTIAIASGKTPADVLRAENPDHFFDSACETNALLDAIVG